jgi:hypothetical protein
MAMLRLTLNRTIHPILTLRQSLILLSQQG